MKTSLNRPNAQWTRASVARGFTLVELLSVIAIVAILAGMLSATVLRARQKAHKARCANNVRQVGLAISQFVADNGEYPLAMNLELWEGKYTAHNTTWLSAINPFLLGGTPITAAQQNQGVLDCPSARKPAEFSAKFGYSDFGYNWNGLGLSMDLRAFGLGGHFSGFGAEAHRAPPVKESEVIAPADLIAFGDGLKGWNGVIQDGLAIISRSPIGEEQAGSTKRSRARHGGAANVYFCDGHVESPTLNSLFVDTSDSALRRWNRDHLPHAERLKP